MDADVAQEWVMVSMETPLSLPGATRQERLIPWHSAGPWSEVYRVYLEKGLDPLSVSRRWSQLPGVSWAEPDPRGVAAGVPDDPVFPVLWGLKNDGTALVNAVEGADIQAVEAWSLEMGAPDVLIAVIDTGVNRVDPDFEGAIWANPLEIADNGIDDDENGLVDDLHGWDFHYGDAEPDDVDGHGSNVASIAVARGDNGVGVVGVCRECSLLPLKALSDEAQGWYSNWAAAMVYAADQGAAVINISAGGSMQSILLHDAVEYADAEGVFVVAAMMNYDNDTPYYPAAFPESVAVGATTVDDTRASPFVWGGGSNFGEHIDLVAPGNLIRGVGTEVGDYTHAWSGTSQATPHVAGVLGLLRSSAPEAESDVLLEALYSEAEDEVGDSSEDTEGWDPYYGDGRLNAYRSLRALQGDPDGDGATVDDCEPDDPEIYPGADEVLGDGVDQDCSGSDAVECFRDRDGDGVGDSLDVSETGVCGNGWALEGGDCDDRDASVVECRGGCQNAPGPMSLSLLFSALFGVQRLSARRRSA